MATYTLDWSETNLGGSAVVSYARGTLLDFTDKPVGATSALSCTAAMGAGDHVLAEFTIQTSGSSLMTFDYHVSTEAGWDKLHIDVDGVSQANYSGIVAWTSHAGISIPSAGTHTIRFRYFKDAGDMNADRVWIAKLNITNTVTVNDASGTVTTHNMEDGAIPSVVTTSTWTNSTSEPIAGSRSLRSPASPANSGTYDLTVTKPATSGYSTVGFDYKTSTETGWDKLLVFPDPGASGRAEFSGSTSGHLAVILPPAASSILVRYTKDGGGAAGSDAVWIDNLTMPAVGGGTTPVTATRSTSWRVRAVVLSVRSTLWDVRTAVSRTRATTWRVLARPAATRATSWDVRTSVTAQRSTSWNVDGTIASVTATRSTSWRTRAAVTATRATTWRARAAVTTIRTASWDTRATVTATRSTTWDTRRTVAATRATTWDTRTAISRALAASWDVRTQVTSQRSSTWNVDSTMVSVSASRSTSWRTLARPVATRSTSWNTRAVVANARATSWDVRTVVSRSAVASWRSLAERTATRSTSWRVLERVTSDRSTTWQVDSDVPPLLDVATGPPRPAAYAVGPARTGPSAGPARQPTYSAGRPT